MKITIAASDDAGNHVKLTREIENVKEARNFIDNVYNMIDCTPPGGYVTVYDNLPSDVEPSSDGYNWSNDVGA